MELLSCPVLGRTPSQLVHHHWSASILNSILSSHPPLCAAYDHPIAFICGFVLRNVHFLDNEVVSTALAGSVMVHTLENGVVHSLLLTVNVAFFNPAPDAPHNWLVFFHDLDDTFLTHDRGGLNRQRSLTAERSMQFSEALFLYTNSIADANVISSMVRFRV